uniref:Chemokine interleukin-8-like domain-containing protein n=1 Tax=Oncorhynchus tshawytscha TaxID=74940 RepID=A0A8C8ETF7_ONCTS
FFLCHDGRSHNLLFQFFFSLSHFLPLSDRRPSKVTTNCCTSVSDTPIKSELQGYRIQNSMPPCVNAIIFYTVKGEKICSDPKTLWVDRRKKASLYKHPPTSLPLQVSLYKPPSTSLPLQASPYHHLE